MKRKHHAILEMLSKSGFGWDDTKKMIQCEKSVYDGWCKNHNDAKGLWNMPFPYYHEITELVGGDRATGKDSETVSEAVDNMDKEVENETTNSIMEENREDSDDDDGYVTEKAYEPTSRSTKKGQRTKKKVSMEGKETIDLTTDFHNVSKSLGTFMQEMNSNLAILANSFSRADEREQEVNDVSSNVLAELLKLEGLTSDEVFQAANILSEEPNKLQVFFQASAKLKKQYILSILYPRGNNN